MVILAQTSGIDALVALVVVVVGFIVGSILAATVRKVASNSSRRSITSSAGALSTLAFSLILIAALIAALGIINQESLDQLLDDFLGFLPNLLSATIVLIIGNIAGAVAETGVEQSLSHVSPDLRKRVPKLVKYAIQGFILVIAANQLGIDTTIISVIVAAFFFGLALAFALLAGIGGRDVAAQVAAGRALRRQFNIGDSINLGEHHGEISAIGSTATQITSHQDVIFIPNSEILQSSVEIIHAASSEQDDPLD